MANIRTNSKEAIERLETILEMLADERSPAYIGRKLGVTRQRVHQIIKAHERDMAAEQSVFDESN